MNDPQSADTARVYGAVTAEQGYLRKEQIDALLAEPRIICLATTDDEGYPYQVPLWVEWDGRDAWFVTRGKSAFMAHIVARPQVSLLRVDGLEGSGANTRILIQGNAEIQAGPGPLVPGEQMHETALRLAIKYQGPEVAARYIERTRDWARYLVRVRPTRIRSWAHHDWHPRYRVG
jgi:hypothetical protein